MKAKELDIIELSRDLPEYGLRKGQKCCVLEVFTEPEEAYLVEYVDGEGWTIIADWITPEQFDLIPAPC